MGIMQLQEMSFNPPDSIQTGVRDIFLIPDLDDCVIKFII